MGLYIEAVVDKRAKITDNLDEIIDNLTEKQAQSLKEFCKKKLPVINHDEFDSQEKANTEILKQCLLQCPEFCYFLDR